LTCVIAPTCAVPGALAGWPPVFRSFYPERAWYPPRLSPQRPLRAPAAQRAIPRPAPRWPGLRLARPAAAPGPVRARACRWPGPRFTSGHGWIWSLIASSLWVA